MVVWTGMGASRKEQPELVQEYPADVFGHGVVENPFRALETDCLPAGTVNG